MSCDNNYNQRLSKTVHERLDNSLYSDQIILKSIYDKLGFVDKIYEDIDLIVDFGCASGTVTRFIHLFYPEARIIGFDTAEVFSNTRADDNDTTEYMSDFDLLSDIVKEATKTDKKSLLVMNSIHHDIFNNMPAWSNKETNNPAVQSINSYYGLLDRLYTMGFTYIFIRDINIKIPTIGKFIEDIPTELAKLTPILIKAGYGDQLSDFITCYNNGELLNPMTIKGQKQYIHFLLKCRYKDDWEHELIIDYLKEDPRFPKNGVYLSTIKKYPYHQVESKNYVLSYIDFINNKEFGIDLRKLGITTHSKALYKRNFINPNKEQSSTEGLDAYE